MDLPTCCCCLKIFDSLPALEAHSFEKYLKFHSDSEDYDICGSRIWFCYGCLKYFCGYENYKNHFRWLPSTPKLC